MLWIECLDFVVDFGGKLSYLLVSLIFWGFLQSFVGVDLEKPFF